MPSGSRTNSSGSSVGVLATKARVSPAASKPVTTRVPASSGSGAPEPSEGTRHTCTSPRSSRENSRCSPCQSGARAPGWGAHWRSSAAVRTRSLPVPTSSTTTRAWEWMTRLSCASVAIRLPSGPNAGRLCERPRSVSGRGAPSTSSTSIRWTSSVSSRSQSLLRAAVTASVRPSGDHAGSPCSYGPPATSRAVAEPSAGTTNTLRGRSMIQPTSSSRENSRSIRRGGRARSSSPSE